MCEHDRRAFLKAATSGVHAALERHVGDFDHLASYRRYLQCSYVFRAPLERMVAHLAAGLASAGFDDLQPTLLASELHQDHLDLGWAPPVPAVDPEPVSNDVEGLMGTLYVLEGSSIGARLLLSEHGARHLKRQIFALPTWRSYLASLEAAPHLEMDRVAAAAVSAFACAHRAFEQGDF